MLTRIYIKAVKQLNLFSLRDLRNFSKNFIYQFLEYAIRFITGIFIGIYFAKYLGPETYGLYSYITAIIILFQMLAGFGIANLIIRELLENPEKRKEIMGTSFWLMQVNSIILISFLFIISGSVTENSNSQNMLLIISFVLIFQTFEIAEVYFQSIERMRYGAIIRIIVNIIFSLLKLYMIFLNLEIIHFIYLLLFENIFKFLLYYSFGFFIKMPFFLSAFSIKILKQLLLKAWPLIFVLFQSIILQKIDVFMIGRMDGYPSVGIYSISLIFYDVWITVPYIISISLFPNLIKSLSDNELFIKKFIFITRILFYMSFTVFILSIFFSEIFVYYFLGTDFIKSSEVIIIMLATACISSLASMTTRYLIAKKKEKEVLYRATIMLVINIILNLILIPKYSILGAAYATLISFFVSYFLYDTLSYHKELIRIKLSSIFFIKYKYV